MNGVFTETYEPPDAPTAEYLKQAYPPTNGQSRYTGQDLPIGDCVFRLEDLAYTRSGDKGNDANIGQLIFFFPLQASVLDKTPFYDIMMRITFV